MKIHDIYLFLSDSKLKAQFSWGLKQSPQSSTRKRKEDREGENQDLTSKWHKRIRSLKPANDKFFNPFNLQVDKFFNPFNLRVDLSFFQLVLDILYLSNQLKNTSPFFASCHNSHIFDNMFLVYNLLSLYRSVFWSKSHVHRLQHKQITSQKSWKLLNWQH